MRVDDLPWADAAAHYLTIDVSAGIRAGKAGGMLVQAKYGRIQSPLSCACPALLPGHLLLHGWLLVDDRWTAFRNACSSVSNFTISVGAVKKLQSVYLCYPRDHNFGAVEKPKSIPPINYRLSGTLIGWHK